ncbi:PAS domain-containing protein [Roseospira marina]|uniref:PAS domain-containing protein n=1 Tax=Roseospira marina TaxID=140057 RepID=A0A5M6I889_9PROT|nr:chemotaxis protein CheB [Roseospira marina]KAA5603959.1 PAS domain-containing protein [Roseospira marina]MBB4315929.1 two-component system CheB/CheR fusion protein [Roseospira marina]MBB5089110.1 two-component system CheB/CheR fusion protein [Roseospira marina]
MDNTAADPKAPMPLLVGVGASAGGLKAFQTLLEVLPPDTGMTFVFIQHLDPEHPSMMTDLLSRRTTMTVREIGDGMVPERDHVYMIPPGEHVILKDGALRLIQPRERRGERMAIDTFFRSLAEERSEDAAAIVLSGTGTDGSLGLREIKERGGLCLVQAPATADYDGMPTSAIRTGVVDNALDIADMPATLLAFERRVRERASSEEAAPSQNAFNRLVSVLAHQSGMDFRFYKTSTVVRRIERRMSMVRIEDADEYLTMLRNDPGERKALSRDLLISVTSFFRDPEVFEALRGMALPELIGDGPEDPLRIWVPGCATGEEAYTLAMLVQDTMDKTMRQRPVQIFATDVDTQALRVAREGVYAEGIAADLPEHWLNRYFVQQDGTYVVGKALRDMVVFAEQNLLTDPPFSRIDLLSCRNLLIYLKNEVQARVMGVFSFALREGGFLLLGSSESVGRADDLFSVVSKKHRLFRRTGQSAIPVLSPPPPSPIAHQAGSAPTRSNTMSIREIAHRAILEHVSPPCVLIDAAHQVRYYHGDTTPFLTQPPGEPTRSLMDMLRPGVKTRLRSLMRTVRENGDPKKPPRVVSESVSVRDPRGQRLAVRLAVATVESQLETLFLIAFQSEETDVLEQDNDAETSWMVRQLEQELTSTREDLQSTIEELETSNEELKASNEEVMSMNEEFQSTNEELETSKEELQSLNEELTTVNAQLQEKVSELEQANNDLTNLFEATDIAVVFVNKNGIINRFTPQAATLFKLRSSDLGRPVSELRLSAMDEGLHERILSVTRSLRPTSHVFESEDDRWFSERINPYRTSDDRIDGVVVSLIDITEETRIQRETARQRTLFSSVMQQATEGIVIAGADGRMVLVNDAARRLATGDPEGARVLDGPRFWGQAYRDDGAAVKPEDWILLRALNSRKALAETARLVRADDRHYDIAISAAPVFDDDGVVVAAVAIFRDITTERRLIADKEVAIATATAANDAKTRFLANLSHDLRTPLNAVLGFTDALLDDVYGTLAAPQAEALRMVLRAAGHLRDLVNDILDMARIEAGHLEMAPTRIPVQAAVAEAVRTARAQSRADRTVVEYELEPEAIAVWADPIRLKQVLINVLDNAFKYGPADGAVRVRARWSDAIGGVCIAVIDQGPGMAEEARAKAFEPFYRGESGDSEVEGVGLGLSLVHRILSLHGGTVRLDEADGGGLAVVMEFPGPPQDARA